MFKCEKHPIRKRWKDCPDCQREAAEANNTPNVTTTINKEDDGFEAPISKPKIAIQESVIVKEKPKEEVKKKVKDNTNKEIIKDVDNELLPIIKKEINKLTPTLLDEYINEEFKDKINKIVSDIYKKAYEKFISEIKSVSHLQYEHLALPMSYFNLTLMNKLQKEGWGFKEILRGDAARISGFKVDSVIFVRIKNEKWPKAPTLKELKGDNNENTK